MWWQASAGTGVLQLDRIDSLGVEAPLELLDDGDAGAAPDAGSTGAHHVEERIGRANAAGSLDLDLGADVFAHEPHVVNGGTAGGKAGARLDEGGLYLARNLAELDLLVIGEQTVLKDDLAGDGLLASFARSVPSRPAHMSSFRL